MMRKILFMLQFSFLFNEQEKKNFVGKDNKLIKENKRHRAKKIIKKGLKNKNENKIVVIIGTIIIILLVVLYWGNDQINKKKRKKAAKEEQEKAKAQQQEQKQEDFNFLKSLKTTLFSNINQEKIQGLFLKYKTKKLYVFFLTEVNKVMFGLFFFDGILKVNFCDAIAMQLLGENIRISYPNFALVTMILDLKKFEEKYRNKVVTEETLKEYVYGPENQRN